MIQIFICDSQKKKNVTINVVSTGIFVAPVTGVYYFTFFVFAGGQRSVDLLLYKNSQLIVMTTDHPTEADQADNGGNAVFLQLQQGDQVYVHMNANTHVWGNNYHTTFSGFLVTQTWELSIIATDCLKSDIKT